jgi:hypothetical protein
MLSEEGWGVRGEADTEFDLAQGLERSAKSSSRGYDLHLDDQRRHSLTTLP